MITDLFVTVLTISMTTSVPVILLMISGSFLNKRYAAKWKYWIWLFLALRLVIPVNGQTAGELLAKASEGKRQAGEASADMEAGESPGFRRIVVELPPQMTTPISIETEKNAADITILDILAAIWFTGGLIFVLVHLLSYWHYRKGLMKTGRPPEDERLMYQLKRLQKEAGIKRKVSAIECGEAPGPMTTGFFTSLMIFPQEKYSDEELYFILKHELFHLKRRDVWFKLLMVTANAVHWFNPVIWLMQREAALDMELSCDEWVVRGKGKDARKAYTEVLISALHKKCSRNIPFSTQFYEGKQIMKKRFKNILSRKKKKNGALILAGILVLTAILGALAGCSVGEDGERKEGIVMEGIEVPAVVLDKAKELVAAWYDNAREGFADYHYENWRIQSLAQRYTYEHFSGMTLQVYQMNYQFLSGTPEKVVPAGGMTVDEEGWVVPDYPDSRFLIFRQEGESLTFLTELFENDCLPGDELFTGDLQGALETLGVISVVERGEEDENGQDMNGQSLSGESASGSNASEENRGTLTVYREGEADEIPAALYAGEGYSIYLTEGDWRQEAADEWVAVYDGAPVLDGRVRLRIRSYEDRTRDEVANELENDGYSPEDYELVRREGEMVYRVRLLEDDGRVWEIFYCHTEEAEEGWGQVLKVMADTFALSLD
ncbi:MAG: hypothetical protein HFI99_06700 [Lachnospiraceae bacterium]|jgi:beta-lactamase regulating signal transducer with metallopeptidase domain|nr:hypothetical protein [Lachnospiraceae bacterium]MCI9327178.1 hypothetical protein [Lachnospiraceae bacterium]